MGLKYKRKARLILHKYYGRGLLYEEGLVTETTEGRYSTLEIRLCLAYCPSLAPNTIVFRAWSIGPN